MRTGARVAAVAGRRAIPPGPTAAFSKSAASGDTSTSFAFTDTSTGSPTSWLWDFGDGTTSTSQNPSHTYAVPNTYTVHLTATNAGGSSGASSGVTVTDVMAGLPGYGTGPDFSSEAAYTDTARTTLAATNADSVAGLTDLSGAGLHATNATPGTLPAMRLVGGKKAIYFDGLSSRPLSTANFFDTTWDKAFVLYLVTEYQWGSGPRVIAGGYGANFYISATLGLGNPVATQIEWYSGGNGGRYHDYVDANAIAWCVRYDGVNKSAHVLGATGGVQKITNAMTANLGLNANLILGDSLVGGGFMWMGYLYRAVLYKSTLHDDTKVAAALAALRARYLGDPGAGAVTAGAGTRRVVCDGNSLTVGTKSTAGNDYPSRLAALLGGGYTVTNTGVFNRATGQQNGASETVVDVLWSASNTRNICVTWEGTNDMYFGDPATTAYYRMRDYCLRRKAKGWQVIVLTVIDRTDGGNTTDFDGRRAAYNTLIRNNYTTFADVLVDLAADGRIGANGASANGAYFDADRVHLNDTGYAIIAAAVNTAVLSLA